MRPQEFLLPEYPVAPVALAFETGKQFGMGEKILENLKGDLGFYDFFDTHVREHCQQAASVRLVDEILKKFVELREMNVEQDLESPVRMEITQLVHQLWAAEPELQKLTKKCNVQQMLLIAGILVGVGAVVALRGIENARNVQTPVYRIAVDGLPEEARGTAAVHWTDLHVDAGEIGTPVTPERVKKLCEQVSATLAEQGVQPEQVLHVFTGDFVNDGTPVADLEKILEELDELLGQKFFVLGNHDVRNPNTEEIVEILQAHNFSMLREEMTVAAGMQLQGVPDAVTQRDQITGEMLANFEKNPTKSVRVLATHNLDALPEATLGNLENTLVLAGHTHGGQWGIISRKYREWILGLISNYEYRSQIETGIAQINKNTTVSVSNGVGTHSLPMRYGADAEIPIWIFEELRGTDEVGEKISGFAKKMKQVFQWE